MASSHLARLRPLASLICLAVLIALALPAESGSKPYLLIQHQVYEEHQEVLGKGPSNRSAATYRKNDEEELFDFIKDYLFNRGGAQKLNSRSGNGRAQFVGVDSGSANGSAASGGAHKDSGESGQRYKMHIIKFRLVNASHPAVAATRNAQAMTMHKKGDHAPPEPFHKEHHADGGGELHTRGYHGNSTPPARHWSGWYRTSHPTHVTTGQTELFPALPRRAAPAAAAGNCELPETTKRTTKRTTTVTTTARHTTTTTTRRTTTTTPKPTTTTKRTTTCAPTTVAAVGCERAPPPPTTRRRRRTTTEAPQLYLHGHPYVVIKLHEVKGTRRVPSHRFSPLPPYLRFLLANGTHPNRTHLASNDSSQVPEHRVFWLPGGWPEAGEETSGGNSSGHQPRGKKQQQQQQLPQQHQQLPQQHQQLPHQEHQLPQQHQQLPQQHQQIPQQHQQQQQQQRSRSRRMPAYAAETAALKREVAGNLMRVLRTIRELDSLAEQDQQDVEQPEEVQDQQLQPEMPQQQATYELVAPDAAAEIDQLLRHRDRSQRFRSQDRGATEYPDELKENRAEEGDLHQFSILLKKALDELSVQPEDKDRAIRKPHRAPAAAVYR